MLKAKARHLMHNFYNFLCSSWKLIAILTICFAFLYYPLGGFLINKINTNTQYEISPQTNSSATIDTAAFLINREVNENLWTPNLPFFFPSYFLDNMPAFQLGVMNGVSRVSDLMANTIEKTIAEEDELYLKQAAVLAKYSGRIWMFSPDKSLAPSANSQYRKARKYLLRYNQDLASGKTVFYKKPEDLRIFLSSISKSLNNSAKKLDSQIREESTSFIDTKADDVFYYNQGKIYAYFLLLKAIGADYQDIIVDNNLYEKWTHLLKALEQGSSLAPLIVRNAELDSITAPNHLSSLAYFAVKASYIANNIASELQKENK